MRTIYIHPHIPKCGGSTVGNFLNRNFVGDKLLAEAQTYPGIQYTSAQISQIIDWYPLFTCLTGHGISLDLPFERDDLDLKVFTFVRDPAQRFVSNYFFERNRSLTNSRVIMWPEAGSMNLSEFVDWGLVEGNLTGRWRTQIQFLARGKFDMIESLISHNRLMLFPLSRLHDSLYTLHKSFPHDFPAFEYNNQNASKKDQSIPPSIIDTIASYFPDDLELLALANQTALSIVPPTPVTPERVFGSDNASLIPAQYVRKLGRGITKLGSWLARI
jgi:hypothetical protein